MSYSVCHITTVHPQSDVRIFLKECCSLASHGFETTLIVIGGSSETKNGVKIIGVPAEFKSRTERIKKAPKLAFDEAVKLNADCYHFHDPEFLPYSKKLIKLGKKVVYDVHEDVPRQIRSKHWIPSFLRGVLSKLLENYENKMSKQLTGIVAATPHIEDRFKAINKNTVNINNYPILDEGVETDSNDFQKRDSVCYLGGLDKQRGTREIVKSVEGTHVKLQLAGNFDPKTYEAEVKTEVGWSNVEYHGFVDREGVANIYSKAFAGLVTLMPIVNYVDSLPVKMFEYMLAGLPVIASNFPLWKSIVEGNECGICVDPTNIEEIRAAILKLSNDKEYAFTLGQNGKRAVLEKYNWTIEEGKLLTFYNRLLDA